MMQRGRKRGTESCHGSLDAKRWLVQGHDERWYVDGTTGRALRLPWEWAEGGIEGTLSPSGDRVCMGDESGFRCVRLPDGAIELVWTRPSSDMYSVYDVAGRRVLFRYAEPEPQPHPNDQSCQEPEPQHHSPMVIAPGSLNPNLTTHRSELPGA